MFILFILYLALPALQLYFFINGQFGASTLDIANFGASIFALHWILANVIMSAKIPVFQKSIPYDARIRFHIVSTAGIAAAVIFHGVYKFVLDYYFSVFTWALMIILGLMLLTALLWIPIPGFRSFRQWILKNMKKGANQNYDQSKNLHRIFILLLGGLLLIHITEAGLASSVIPLSKVLYWVLYAGSFGALLLSFSGIFKVKAEVLSIEEKQGIMTIHLQPENRIRYKSGQFTFLKSEHIPDVKEEHPFSFLSHKPADDLSSGTEPVSIAVRNVGDFTSNLALLKPGDKVQLRGAFGNFRPGREEALCFIASGIGTVPILSIFKELHSKGDSRQIKLFLAVNHIDELPEGEKILDLASKMENVEVHLMVFNEDGLRFSEDFFRERLSDHRRYSYYLCSSPGVRNIVFNALKNMGIKSKAIHYEAFSFG